MKLANIKIIEDNSTSNINTPGIAADLPSENQQFIYYLYNLNFELRNQILYCDIKKLTILWSTSGGGRNQLKRRL